MVGTSHLPVRMASRTTSGDAGTLLMRTPMATRYGVQDSRCDGHGRNLGNALGTERALRFRVLD